MPKLFKYFLIAVSLLGCGAAMAAPRLCSPGYQDSTCVTPISRAPIAAPQCSTAAGWTTSYPAVWQGAQWSQPGCNYQAPPSCPPGYTQNSAPWWNGSSWVGLGCQPTTPPTPPGPTCQYGPTPSNNSIYLAGTNCSADGGCSGSSLTVIWNNQWVLNRQFNTLTDDPATEPQVAAALAGTGYSRGNLMAAGGSNGNTSNSYFWQVCH